MRSYTEYSNLLKNDSFCSRIAWALRVVAANVLKETPVNNTVTLAFNKREAKAFQILGGFDAAVQACQIVLTETDNVNDQTSDDDMVQAVTEVFDVLSGVTYADKQTN